MHPNQSRPIPTPPLHAVAWGTASAVLDPKGYFETLADIMTWADQDPTLHTMHVSETLTAYPYRANGRIFRRVNGAWVEARRNDQ